MGCSQDTACRFAVYELCPERVGLSFPTVMAHMDVDYVHALDHYTHALGHNAQALGHYLHTLGHSLPTHPRPLHTHTVCHHAHALSHYLHALGHYVQAVDDDNKPAWPSWAGGVLSGCERSK
jgi:hypothetical protein